MSTSPGDGGWSGTAPSCETITCSTLSSILNGQVIFSSASPFSFGTEATYLCDDGYGLTGGNRIRTCDGSGSSPVGVWSGSVPTCEAITCSGLTSPTNAMITFSPSSSVPYSFGTMASYSCVSGFGLSGRDASRTCEGDGSSPSGVWSGVVPSCGAIICASLSSINNGAITYSPDISSLFNYSTTATYTCNDGFYLVGDSTQTCDGDGSGVNGVWSGSPPVCSAVMCPVLSVPENSAITYSEDSSSSLGFLGTATYSCNTGFGLSDGDTVRTCVGAAGSSGEWTGTAPTCEAITCISLGAPTNGEVTYSSDTTSPFNYGTVATFTCNTGFGLIGNMTRTCGGDESSPVGLWNEVTPTCVAYSCLSLPSIINGLITYTPNRPSPFVFGTTATYSCNEGYYLSQSVIRTCTGSGSTSFWDGEEPECIETVCTSLMAPINGLISYSPDTTPPYNYQTTATYSCSTGFGLVGGDRIRQCLNSSSGDGEWVGTAPTCEAITCPALFPLSNGGVDFSTASPYTYGTTASYSCNEGYWVNGDAMRTCGGDDSSPIGVWSGEVPTCDAITCSDLDDISNGMIVISPSSSAPYSFGTMASYSCGIGFGLSGGDATRTCGGDGSSPSGVWSGVVPSCIAISCTSLVSIIKGKIEYSANQTSPFNFGTVATYSCQEGFFIKGNNQRTCGGDGSTVDGIWSGSSPECSAIVCLKLSAPENGRITYSDNTSSSLGLMDTAIYSCDPGFGLFGGDTVRTCIKAGKSLGEWTGTAPTCQFKEVAGNPEALRVGASVGGVIAVVLALIFIALLAIVVITLKSRRKSVTIDTSTICENPMYMEAHSQKISKIEFSMDENPMYMETPKACHSSKDDPIYEKIIN